MLRLPGLGKHGRTKRWDPRTTLVLVALAMLAPVAGAASTVKLSDPLASIQSALHAATNSKPPQGTTGGAVSPIALATSPEFRNACQPLLSSLPYSGTQ